MEVDARATTERMEVDATARATPIEHLLLEAEFAKSLLSVKDALGRLEIIPWTSLSAELTWLKRLEWLKSPDCYATLSCGMKAYLLDNELDKVQNLEKRKSNLMFERDCFVPLYEKIMNTWREEPKEKIILTGNAGTGKSWFQVYFLHRLLNEEEDQFRFVVRQFGTEFFLMDLQTRRGWKLQGDPGMIEMLLDSLKKTLYMYEPGLEVDQPPRATSAPSLSTLSPRPKRIKEYEKFSPLLLYMPVWEPNELAVVAEIENNMEGADLEDNYYKFGGIIRHTLGTKVKQATEKLDNRCNRVGKDIFRSVSVNIDDDADADSQTNISGFLVCYVDIPRDGENAFAEKSLAMTSAYARKKVLEKFGLESAQDRLHLLASHLDNRTKDITGIDLESAVVQMLAAGPRTVKWNYCPVGAQAPYPSVPLGHTKRDIKRESDFNKSGLNYPRDRIFGLADCFVYIKNEWCAFQTTWQYDHAFKLLTLFEFRGRLGMDVNEKLNLFFVNPKHADSYRKRAKDDYLAKGESADSPIISHQKKVLMEADAVKTMWENTNIFVASPEDNNWVHAVSKCLASQ